MPRLFPMFDPDDNENDDLEGGALESLLDALDDSDLGSWDRGFVDDLLARIKKQSAQAVARALTARQREQLNRMKGQYHVEKSDKADYF